MPTVSVGRSGAWRVPWPRATTNASDQRGDEPEREQRAKDAGPPRGSAEAAAARCSGSRGGAGAVAQPGRPFTPSRTRSTSSVAFAGRRRLGRPGKRAGVLGERRLVDAVELLGERLERPPAVLAVLPLARPFDEPESALERRQRRLGLRLRGRPPLAVLPAQEQCRGREKQERPEDEQRREQVRARDPRDPGQRAIPGAEEELRRPELRLVDPGDRLERRPADDPQQALARLLVVDEQRRAEAEGSAVATSGLVRPCRALQAAPGCTAGRGSAGASSSAAA